MENVWEVVCKVNGKFADSTTFNRGDLDIDIMRTENSGWIIISETAKDWIEKNISDYIECDDFSLFPYYIDNDCKLNTIDFDGQKSTNH